MPIASLGHEGQSELIEELIVYARSQQVIGVAQAASEGIVGYDDMRLPSLMRLGDLAEAVPGMVQRNIQAPERRISTFCANLISTMAQISRRSQTVCPSTCVLTVTGKDIWISIT